MQTQTQSSQPELEADDNVVSITQSRETTRKNISEYLDFLISSVNSKNAESESRLNELELKTVQLNDASDALVKLSSDQQDHISLLEESADQDATRLEALESKTETLESKTETLENSTLELHSRTGKLESDVSVLNDQASAASDLLIYLEQETARIHEQKESLETDLRDTDRRLESEHDALAKRVDILEPRQEALKDSTGNLHKRASSLDMKVAGLKEHAENTEQHFNKISWVTAGAILVLSAVVGTSIWQGKQITDGLAAQSGAFENALVQSNVNEQSKISVLVRELQGKLAVFEGLVDKSISGSSALRGDYQVLAEDVKVLGSQYKSDISVLSQELRSELVAIQGLVDANSSDSSELQGSYQALSGDIQALGSQLGRFEERLFVDDADRIVNPVSLSELRDVAWIQSQNPRHFSIQLMGVYQERAIAHFASLYREHLSIGNLGYFNRIRNGKDWYVMVLGDFSSFDQAQKVLQSLPSAIQNNNPFIRSFGSIQKDASS